LPLLLGVDVRVVAEPFEARLDPVAEIAVAPGRVEGRGRSYALGHGNAEMIALGRLLAKGVGVRWASRAFEDGGRRFAAGTLLVPGSARGRLDALARTLGIGVRGVDARPSALALRQPRVGLYQSWLAPMDEGWTRYVFEHEAGVPYETLRDADVRRGELIRRFDAIVLPDQRRRALLEGHESGSLPEEYCGGLGAAGVAALRAFVEAGGTLIALNRATELPLAEFGLAIENALASLQASDYYCPGSLLRAHVDPAHPLGHGLGETVALWCEDSPAFAASTGRVVLRYDEPSPLLSGFLQGGERLPGKAALVEAPLGRGRVVLFGFRPQYRAQSWSTYVPFLNAIYLSAAAAP
jgi:hypothetical protein